MKNFARLLGLGGKRFVILLLKIPEARSERKLIFKLADGAVGHVEKT